MNNDRLGKGLSAIIGGNVPSVEELRRPVEYINKQVADPASKTQNNSDILRIPIGMIQPNPYQPRKTFDQEKLEELCASIKTLGLITPISVRKISDKEYQIISGERRFKACSMAGLSEVPAYVISANDQSMLEMAIVENIQRENLDPIEVSLSYQRLMDECHLTQEAVADRLGKKRASIANQLRLLKLPLKIQHDLKVGLISVGHAKVLLGVEQSEVQEALCDQVIREDLNVRDLEKRVQKLLEGGTKQPHKPAKLPESYTRLTKALNGIFGDKVNIKRGTKGGTITIKFSSDSDVEEFINALQK